MAHVLNGRFLCELHWEPLLGLERETREVSRLLKRREANAHVVAGTTQLDRILGSAHLDLDASVPPPALVAFASALADVVEHPRFLFTHVFAEGDALEGHVLLIGAREKRIDLDRVVPVDEATEVAEGFLRLNAADGVAIMGLEGQAGVTYPYTLEEAVSALDKHDLACHAVHIRRVIDKRLVRAGVAIGLTLTLATVAWLGWPEAPPPLPVVRRVPVIDHAAVFRLAWQKKLIEETEKGGPYYAQFVLDTVRQLPVDKEGWRLQRVVCGADDCTVTRVRGSGADTKSLLQDDAEIILDEKLETATRRIAAPAPSDQSAKVRPVPNAVFQEDVVSRFQALADYGMSPRITPSAPLLVAPSATKEPVDTPRSGAWELSGDLAFLDSIALMVIRSNNMVWRSLEVIIDGTTPTFIAKGTYFVL